MKAWILYLIRRVILMIVSLWALASVTFLLVSLLPVDPARAVAGEYATEEQIADVAAKLGLDQPLIVRYGVFMGELLRGDFGDDIYTGAPVMDAITQRLPSTAELVVLGMTVGIIVGIALGVLAAYYQGRWQEKLSSGVVAVLQALPDFVIAVVLMYLFAYLVRWAPGPEGQLAITTPRPPPVTGMILVDSLLAGHTATFGDAVTHVILPVLSLGLALGALFARVSRAALRDALESDQTRFARACGLREPTVLAYALRSARTPILAYGAMMLGTMFGGTAVIETVFNWNGASQWAVLAMLNNNFPAIQAYVIVTGAITLTIYVLLDVITALFDPRVRVVPSS